MKYLNIINLCIIYSYTEFVYIFDKIDNFDNNIEIFNQNYLQYRLFIDRKHNFSNFIVSKYHNILSKNDVQLIEKLSKINLIKYFI